MKRSVRFVGLFLAAASTVALAQEARNASAPAGTSPTAYVYVSSSPSSGTYEINGYSAAANGELSPVSGSPFTSQGVQSMALNGTYLFGTNGTDIESYSIESSGALQYVSSVNATQYNPYNSGGPGPLFLDHSGKTLYDGDIYAQGTGDNAYQFFTIENGGGLNYLGLGADYGVMQGLPLSFVGSNLYAYTSNSYEFSPAILGYQRNQDGSLTELTMSPKYPSAPAGVQYLPYLAASDPTNNLAISMQATKNFVNVGQPQLAVYLADASGNLTTTSTSTNMPRTAVGGVFDLKMSPSGKFLAVAGSAGLQVFHFNGSQPITNYTGLLVKGEVDQVFWDNANHLYAISRTAGELYVFTITAGGHTQAPGSPYTVTGPQNIIVLPKS
jgi:hypothetical protein